MTLAGWTRRYGRAALAQGWAVFEVNGGGVEIERDDEAGIFADDEAAVDFVGAAALRGDKGALAALRLVNGT
jgi:hypothetical protein